jgi:uncharacterized protein
VAIGTGISEGETMTSRRNLLAAAGAAGALAGLQRVFAGNAAGAAGDAAGAAGNAAGAGADPAAGPFGPLLADPGGILDLPRGFSYRIVSRVGEPMDDGLLVPGDHDGMAAFAAGRGRVALICNHELGHDELDKSPFGPAGERLLRVDRERLFDNGRLSPSLGGTTTLIYHQRRGRVERHFLSLAGTERNCAGGPTPWGSWLSCEETTALADDQRARDHGWVFEVPAMARRLVHAVPLKALGRFNHEAAAVDPVSGVVYLTEDEGDGLFYRLLPERPGDLAAGGRLQALALRDWDGSADTRNWPLESAAPFPVGTALAAAWIDLADTDAPDDDLRLRGRAAGAAVFARGEGVWFGNGEVYFACTSGGRIEAGQIFRYRPSSDEGGAGERSAPGTLELFVESSDQRQLDRADNLTVSPWGDLIVCEDASTPCSLVGVTPAGGLYRFAENAYSESELAGACFSPDGRTLFVNVQKHGLTLAIDGPFPRV